jgi:hypothetical protein
MNNLKKEIMKMIENSDIENFSVYDQDNGRFSIDITLKQNNLSMVSVSITDEERKNLKPGTVLYDDGSIDDE